jgi:hypothetical protein
MTADMHLPEVVSPEEWLAARKDLLVKEEEPSLVRHPLFAAVVGAVLGAVLTNPGWHGTVQRRSSASYRAFSPDAYPPTAERLAFSEVRC